MTCPRVIKTQGEFLFTHVSYKITNVSTDSYAASECSAPPPRLPSPPPRVSVSVYWSLSVPVSLSLSVCLSLSLFLDILRSGTWVKSVAVMALR